MDIHALLSEPLALGPLTAPNRIVMPPLVIWQADESGTVTQGHLDHYRRSAGPGLVIVEATTVAPEGRLAKTQLGIWSDDHIDGLSQLARTIKSEGALAGIQIHHAGGNATLEKTYGLAPRVPSLGEWAPDGAVELSPEAVDAALAAFGDATTRALTAGFDVIELHGAHGYLISQFLSPETNRRTDDWGGTAAKRRAFMVAALRTARDRIVRAGRTETAALTIRLGLAASAKRALPLDEGLAAAEAAVEAGADFLDISNAGGIDDELANAIRSRVSPQLARPDRSPTMLLARVAKDRVTVPVVGVNGIKHPEQAARAIEEGVADAVAVGRGILADPRWAAKATGRDDRPIEVCRDCKPRCFWFGAPARCPARAALAHRGEQPALV